MKFSNNILRKVTPIQNEILLNILIAIGIFIVSLIPKNYALSTYLSNIVYKYSFFILVIGISFAILLLATVKKVIRRWLSRVKTQSTL